MSLDERSQSLWSVSPTLQNTKSCYCYGRLRYTRTLCHSFAVRSQPLSITARTPPHVRCSAKCLYKKSPLFRSPPFSYFTRARNINDRGVNKDHSVASFLNKMPTTASTSSTPAFPSSLLRRSTVLLAAAPRPSWPLAAAASAAARWSISCQVALATDVSPSSPDAIAEEEAEAAAKIGAKIRVKEAIKVYHVVKVPGLDLCGMEGMIKQYVGVWKGKRISANLPFKVEFFISVEGQEKPVKFVAHLKEDEFEYLNASD